MIKCLKYRVGTGEVLATYTVPDETTALMQTGDDEAIAWTEEDAYGKYFDENTNRLVDQQQMPFDVEYVTEGVWIRGLPDGAVAEIAGETMPVEQNAVFASLGPKGPRQKGVVLRCPPQYRDERFPIGRHLSQRATKS